MTENGQRYIALWNFEKAIDWGLYLGMPYYTRHVLMLQIRHAQYPSGWVWVGQKRAEITLGICGRDWYKSLYFLAENSYYKAWGKQKTFGRPALAFKLDLGVPKGKLEVPYPIPRKHYADSARKVSSLTLRALEAYFTSKIGQPYEHIEIEKDITILNDINEGVAKQPEELKTEEKKKQEGLEPGSKLKSIPLEEDPAYLKALHEYPKYKEELDWNIKDILLKGVPRGKAIHNAVILIKYIIKKRPSLVCCTDIPPELLAGA